MISRRVKFIPRFLSSSIRLSSLLATPSPQLGIGRLRHSKTSYAQGEGDKTDLPYSSPEV